MNLKSAVIIGLIGKCVLKDWPKAPKSDRLTIVKYYLKARPIKSDFTLSQPNKYTINITVGDELIVLTEDGDLGLYYPTTDKEPIRISLLHRKTVRLTKTYDYEIPVTGSESDELLFDIATTNSYDPIVTIIKREIICV